ncbi:PREDICTED: serine--tRNA ligase, cytoplasmic-like, partial [Priapulus caudatus]|uniref:Serine--tRNA ligase, cytoplasmic-like n=1 Tax=Priapulus caudatus TaxID=37621 RepID=A0ABM1EUN7_PRICU
MVLDIELFRAEKGGDPAKIRENQAKRFDDVTLVDKVLDADATWRKLRFQTDLWNRLKNLCSKTIGDKMKKQKPVGDSDLLPNDLEANLESLTTETLQALTVTQIKKLH